MFCLVNIEFYSHRILWLCAMFIFLVWKNSNKKVALLYERSIDRLSSFTSKDTNTCKSCVLLQFQNMCSIVSASILGLLGLFYLKENLCLELNDWFCFETIVIYTRCFTNMTPFSKNLKFWFKILNICTTFGCIFPEYIWSVTNVIIIMCKGSP